MEGMGELFGRSYRLTHLVPGCPDMSVVAGAGKMVYDLVGVDLAAAGNEGIVYQKLRLLVGSHLLAHITNGAPRHLVFHTDLDLEEVKALRLPPPEPQTDMVEGPMPCDPWKVASKRKLRDRKHAFIDFLRCF